MSNEAFDLLKDIVGWLSAPLLGLVAWAWNQNEKEHERLRAANKELADKAAAIRQHTSDGYSVLNDRVMDHIDAQVKEVRMFVIAEDTKLMAEMGVQRGHIAKIFDKIEAQSQRSEDRHLETLSEIRNLSNAMHQALAKKADK